MSDYRQKLNDNGKSDVTEDVDTLLRYHRKGIPLTPKQIDFLQSRGVQITDNHTKMLEILP